MPVQLLAAGLVAQYIFGAGGRVAKDTSGNGYDAEIHDAGYSDELPPATRVAALGLGVILVTSVSRLAANGAGHSAPFSSRAWRARSTASISPE